MNFSTRSLSLERERLNKSPDQTLSAFDQKERVYQKESIRGRVSEGEHPKVGLLIVGQTMARVTARLDVPAELGEQS